MRNELKMLTGIMLLMFSISSVSGIAAEKKSEAAGEESGLLREFHLSSAIDTHKDNFDHLTDQFVNLVFVPGDDKPVRVASSVWYDPDDKEYRTIRMVYDRSQEAEKGIKTPEDGYTRVRLHSMPTKELYDHMPGRWKVALYIEDQLAGTQTFLIGTPSSESGNVLRKDELPPLPPIEETKPPLAMKSEYFKFFPWSELPKPRKDGNDPNTIVYTIQEGDTLEKVAETQMGNRNLAQDLAAYNDLASPEVAPGDKIVVPNPIVGMKSEILVRTKGQSDFIPLPFDVDLKPDEEYKLSFEPNMSGYAYILREDPKGMEMLYPMRQLEVMTGGKGGKSLAASQYSDKVEPNQTIEIPGGPESFAFDPKKRGDRIVVFFSMRRIPELEDLIEITLRSKKKIRSDDVEDVMIRVKQGEVFSQPPYHLLRVSDPTDTLGFTLNING